MAVEIDAIQSAKSIGWTDALLSRLAANSVGLGARLSITAPANASALSSTGYSLTGSNASSMIDLAGTWNTTGTPTLIKANVTDTASNAASLLMDLQVGGSSRAAISKAGNLVLTRSGIVAAVESSNGYDLIFKCNGLQQAAFNNASNLNLNGGGSLSFNGDTFALRDAANTLALRNGANAQAFNVYNTYTSGSVYERGFVRWVSNVLEIGTEHVGASVREFSIKRGNVAFIQSVSGGLVLGAGASPAITVGDAGNTGRIGFFAGASISGVTDTGSLRLNNPAFNGFGMLQFGGGTSSFPALKRSSTVLQSRLADDSDFAPLQGRLRSHANATSETPTATHTLRLFDAAGTEYRVLAIAV